ncbi:hypothetical protein GIB67_015249 [Kingdonia uniflora]|uniref:Uncharacterized protein n=1 Tax=Kingdonia uniflora TaxID=39325 RepID=A0A7J7MST9_9MAGN|nr:hypothetical protein GIB67_015249 [Kingdonia uniflora]
MGFLATTMEEGGGNTSETEFGFQRNEFRQSPLVGTVQIYDQHVFLCYKNPQVWPPHVEAAEFDRLSMLLSVELLARKAQMKKQRSFFFVTNGSILYKDGRFLVPLKARMGNTKIPPGQMGLPVLGELLNFLWYFKIVGRPDDFIISKRERWPALDIVGQKSLVVLNGKAHARLRSYVSNAINKPEALKKIAKLVQPRIVDFLCSWVEKGKIRGIEETRKKKTYGDIQAELEKKKGNGSEEGDDLTDGLMRIK